MLHKALLDTTLILTPTLGGRVEGTLREGKCNKTRILVFLFQFPCHYGKMFNYLEVINSVITLLRLNLILISNTMLACMVTAHKPI